MMTTSTPQLITEEEIIASVSSFQDRLSYIFADSKNLVLAFTHRSFLNERKDLGWVHNERVEFLGDAVLELIITEFLYNKYQKKPEGELTAVRSYLVNTASLSAAATRLFMNDYLLLSKGEAKDTGRARSFILANTFEAVIGALYLDGGFEVAKQFVLKNLCEDVDTIVEKKLWQDAKSLFQEKAQEEFKITPTYTVLTDQGPDHDKEFTVGVYLKDEKIAEGVGKSKQEAEQDAAQAGLKKYSWR